MHLDFALFVFFMLFAIFMALRAAACRRMDSLFFYLMVDLGIGLWYFLDPRTFSGDRLTNLTGIGIVGVVDITCLLYVFLCKR